MHRCSNTCTFPASCLHANVLLEPFQQSCYYGVIVCLQPRTIFACLVHAKSIITSALLELIRCRVTALLELCCLILTQYIVYALRFTLSLSLSLSLSRARARALSLSAARVTMVYWTPFHEKGEEPAVDRVGA